MTSQHGLIFDIQRFSIHDGPGIRTIVFLKGCPLRCAWCANPESQRGDPQIAWFEDRCAGCGTCESVCAPAAITVVDGRPLTDRSRCVACGRCGEACARGARRLMGVSMSVDQLMGEVRKDAVFYRRSGGGVTFSGGEPLQQASFLVECLRRCQLWGYHTTVETCGQTSWADLRAAAEHTDLFLYDVKHLDPERHRQYTGHDNRRILGNLVRLLDIGARVVVRVPIVPSCNDDADNVRALAIFAAEHQLIRCIELLSYHRLGLHKYAAVGAPPPSPLEEPRSDSLESMRRYVADVSGVECKVTLSFK